MFQVFEPDAPVSVVLTRPSAPFATTTSSGAEGRQQSPKPGRPTCGRGGVPAGAVMAAVERVAASYRRCVLLNPDAPDALAKTWLTKVSHRPSTLEVLRLSGR